MLVKRGSSLLLTYIPIANAAEKLVETIHTHDKESPVLPHLSKLLVTRGSVLNSFQPASHFLGWALIRRRRQIMPFFCTDSRDSLTV
jgi:hypothetical protein